MTPKRLLVRPDRQGQLASLDACVIFRFNEDRLIISEEHYSNARTVMKQLDRPRHAVGATSRAELPSRTSNLPIVLASGVLTWQLENRPGSSAVNGRPVLPTNVP